MRKLFGIIVAVAAYVPVILLARWVGGDKDPLGLIAAGLFSEAKTRVIGRRSPAPRL